MHFNILQQFRQQVYTCFERGADALFNVCDALLVEPQARSLVELSQAPCFERRWSSLYQALTNGKINDAALRTVCIQAFLQQRASDELICLSVDSSSVPRPEAQTSPDRGIIYVPNLPRASKPISAGWHFSTMMLLPSEPGSWVGILDQRRIPTHQTAIEVAIMQLREVVPQLPRRVLILADRWYATADFLRVCRALGCEVLIRLKRNRKLYRAPVRTSTRGRRPLDGPLLQGTRPETLTGVDESFVGTDEKGRAVHLTRWNGLHFQQGRDVEVAVVRVMREGAKDSKRDPRESWFVQLSTQTALPLIAPTYALRFSQEHAYRFMKQDLLWTQAHVRMPEQFERWSLLVALALNQLALACHLGQAEYRPWESKQRSLTPRQVRRIMPSLLARLGTPACRCQPRGNSPGRACGFHPQPAPRYPVILKRKRKAKIEG
ncbi:transposase [Ktedonosporobacter rubrisoli]|uniref:Transposase n=1 Tax=Ktedonosporobacter rubrisoli TaxID=2509675 RepID=A0A4P6JXP8_KTERU|nr:NF041680 family putative transposase [Ktedonosporobacter rubrisoli]QBD80537.1 transposase [Ktedonosporobacter rubrisoli]